MQGIGQQVAKLASPFRSHTNKKEILKNLADNTEPFSSETFNQLNENHKKGEIARGAVYGTVLAFVKESKILPSKADFKDYLTTLGVDKADIHLQSESFSTYYKQVCDFVVFGTPLQNSGGPSGIQYSKIDSTPYAYYTAQGILISAMPSQVTGTDKTSIATVEQLVPIGQNGCVALLSGAHSGGAQPIAYAQQIVVGDTSCNPIHALRAMALGGIVHCNNENLQKLEDVFFLVDQINKFGDTRNFNIREPDGTEKFYTKIDQFIKKLEPYKENSLAATAIKSLEEFKKTLETDLLRTENSNSEKMTDVVQSFKENLTKYSAELENLVKIFLVPLFQQMLNSCVAIIDSSVQVVFDGDTLDDAYKCNALQLCLYSFMHQKGLDYCIIESNHDVDFMSKMKDLEKISPLSFQEFINTYVNKKVAVVLSRDGASVHTHAICTNQLLLNLAEISIQDFNNPTKKWDLHALVTRINERYRRLLNTNSLDTLSSSYGDDGPFYQENSPWYELTSANYYLREPSHMLLDAVGRRPLDGVVNIHGHTEADIQKILESLSRELENKEALQLDFALVFEFTKKTPDERIIEAQKLLTNQGEANTKNEKTPLATLLENLSQSLHLLDRQSQQKLNDLKILARLDYAIKHPLAHITLNRTAQPEEVEKMVMPLYFVAKK
ncbi:MAG: hypothetical protein V4591_04170 [Bdellovibrionota bacterium]